MDNVIDLTACVAKGKTIKIDDKEYELKFSFRAIRALEEIYGNMDTALDSFIEQKKIYDDVLNFIFAALGEKYKLKKTDVEEWITVSSTPILYNAIFEEILLSMNTDNEDEEQGEV